VFLLPAAHGSKQLRTPERSQQQRMLQQRFCPMPESAHKQQAASRSASTNSSYHNGSLGGYQQMASSASGSSLAAGSPSNSSASTNISASAMAQLQGFPACAPYAQQQQQQALMTSALLNQADGSSPMQLQALLGANGNLDGDLSQLLHSIAAEANASKREAAEHSRAAVLAQQKLQILEQLLGCNGAAYGGAPAGVTQGLCSTPLTSPVAGAWQMSGGAAQQLPPTGPQLSQLLHMQQEMAAHGSCDGPRRHSLDESLLRRVRNMPASSNVSNLGRGAGLWNTSGSAALYNLAAVNEGVALGMSPDASAQADLEALAAACASAGLPVDSLLNRGQGMQFGGSGLPPPASAALAAAQLSGGSNGGWVAPQQQGVDAGMWAQLGGTWGVAAAPVNAYYSSQHLPTIPLSSAALMNGNGSISAPQLQSDYLLQLHAALQANAMNAAPKPERASFDVAAAYLPPMPSDLLAGRTAAAELLAAADDAAGASNGSVYRSSGQSNVQDSAAAAPACADKLATNPIGGAGQLGWF
jgi:hypothetical protein